MKRGQNTGLYVLGGVIALYALCKAGKLPWKICNIFKAGLPGGTFAGAGGAVTIGSPTIQLATLFTRFDKIGQGRDSIKDIQPGDLVPDPFRVIGSQTPAGTIVGYIRNNRPDLTNSGRVVQYLVRDRNDVTPGMIDPAGLNDFREWRKVTV